MEVEVIGITNLSKCVSTDKITCCYAVGDLAVICRERVYISSSFSGHHSRRKYDRLLGAMLSKAFNKK